MEKDIVPHSAKRYVAEKRVEISALPNKLICYIYFLFTRETKDYKISVQSWKESLQVERQIFHEANLTCLAFSRNNPTMCFLYAHSISCQVGHFSG